ncbi:MAG: PIG-L family deacetylase [Acidobacteriia bacterium]|nr:PIG-L family deacetylase [Terriglobia bacterium]
MNIIFIGAHPDDCETKCGGTAALLAAAGHKVHFVSVTDGSAGHQSDYGATVAARRRLECDESARRLGLAGYHILPNADGHLLPTLEARADIIRLLRQTQADIVVTHRPCDYHPDHRYTAALVQDSAYLVMVPGVCPDVAPLRANPVYLYMWDHFRKPAPFQADISVDVTKFLQQKLSGLDAHVSQYYEWLPWVSGKDFLGAPEDVPATPDARRTWLHERFLAVFGANYTSESYEICEYGRQPEPTELQRVFTGLQWT